MPKNENRLGYKKTKIGWIPEEWEICKASDVMDVRDGTHDTPKKKEAGVLLITSKNIIHGRINTSYCYYISEQDASLINKRSAVAHGDILMSMIGTVGESALIEGTPDFCIKNVGLFKKNESRITSQYLIKYFHSTSSRRAVRHASNGGIQKFISLTGLRQLFIPLPPLPEQQAIAGVLECWDKAIRNYEKRIEKKRNIKKGLMQRLLSGKQRLPGFSGEWKEVRLEDVGRFSKGKGISKEEVSDTGLPCIRYGEIYTSDDYIITRFRSFISSKLAMQCTLIKQNDLLLAGSGETINEIGKSIAYMGTEEAYAGGDIIIFSASAASARGDYLSFYLNTEGRRALGRLGQGQSVVHIYARNIANLCIPLPAIEEQQAIAAVLSAADSEIVALERKLARLKDQKKFLLNNLVTGTIRLPRFRGGTINTGADGDHA